METSLHMDLARRSGIAAFGSPRSELLGTLEIKGTGSHLVLQTALASPVGYQELYVDATGALKNRAAPGGDLTRAATFGDNQIPSCAVWVRGDKDSCLILHREDNGMPYKIAPAGTADTLTCAQVLTQIDEGGENYSAIGPDLSGTSRVWVKSRPGTGAGLILQIAGVPWVIYVDAANALKCQPVA